MDTTSDYFEDLPIVLEKGLKKNGRTIEDLKKDIHIVKEWIQTQPHFPETPDDNTIVNFLFMNKFSIENVKNKFDMYYTIRTVLPEFFRNKHPLQSRMQNTMDTMFWISLPKVTDEGYRVNIFNLPQANSESFDVINCLTYSYNVFEVRLHEDYTVGEIFIYDCNNVTMGHVIKVTPTIET
ncbi:uncharacterized protein [Leptinotarsa decemlineata]|uniref:uncharacterized protein n=1 Tax=Leptinotarsa decemlineata TaxID=7539 RepID=UPI003D305D64